MSQTTCRYTYTAELPNGQTYADQHLNLMMKFQAIEQKLYQDTEWKIGVDQKLQALLDIFGPSRPMTTPSGLPTNQSPPPHYGQGPQNYGQGPQTYGQVPQTYGQVPQNYGQVPQNYGQAAPPYVQASIIFKLVRVTPRHLVILLLVRQPHKPQVTTRGPTLVCL
jgi:hypothetical protein